MKLKQKLMNARKEIAGTSMKKEGHNSYSGYDYFTPSQVSKLVNDACVNNGILTMFNLLRNELGYYATLTLENVDADERVTFTLVTDMPEIKATNVTQKLGGMATYTQRYLEMSTFGIIDNNLDPDSQKPEPPQKKPTKKKTEEFLAPDRFKKATPDHGKKPEPGEAMNDYWFKKALTSLESGATTYDNLKKYKLTKAQAEELLAFDVELKTRKA